MIQAVHHSLPIFLALLPSDRVLNKIFWTEGQQKGKHSTKVVDELCDQLKKSDRFSGQPSRFSMSAGKAVNYIFKSWFTLQKRLKQRLSGKQKWLNILKSDTELTEICGQELEVIRTRATQLLQQIEESIYSKQPLSGTFQEKARGVAIAAYELRAAVQKS